MPKSKKVYVKTYGCYMNVYDSQKMEDLLKPLGYTPTQDPQESDLAILNTCHIREKATEKVYSDLGRLRAIKQDNPNLIIAVGGCVGQAEGEEILRRAPYVDMVFGPQTYHRLPEMLAQALRHKDQNKKGPGRGVLDIEFPIDKFDNLPLVSKNPGVSALITIQEGCDKFCRFCCVPYTRGAEYSRSVVSVLEEAKTLCAQGALEIILLGQNVNAYHGEGPHGKPWGLGRLLQALAEIPGIKRLRYTTSHPRDVDQELIQAHGDLDVLMPYLHLPVQSGSTQMLTAMNRKHTREDYLEIIAKLRQARPSIAFSSDFIVGYPGETAEDFEHTLSLVEEVTFAQAYSFKYSRRPGTPASALEDQIREEVKDERLHKLQELLWKQQKAFNQSLIGTVQPVLLEKPGRHAGQRLGKSPYLQSVHVEAPEILPSPLVEVHITHGTQNSLTGTLVGV